MLYPTLQAYIESTLVDFGTISADRKQMLRQVGDWIQAQLKSKLSVHLNFICTHNSRRSHFGQVWTATAAAYYQIQNIHTYSGGTEATAFNRRSVEALQRAGFEVEIKSDTNGGENPHYLLSFSKNKPSMVCFSKKYDDSFNPSKNFAAIMTCNHADTNCPVVFGALKRFAITYEDPKVVDNTHIEKEIYDERCRQIAAEMFYMLSLIDGENNH